MKIKHLFTSLSASFDEMTTKIENHEAIADSLIQDVSKAAAQVRNQLNQQQRQLKQQQIQEDRIKSDCKKWQERALLTRESEPDKALQCLRASKRSEAELSQLQTQSQENQELIRELTHELSQIENQLQSLQHKRVSLSARDARNQALGLAHSNTASGEADKIFNRWESKVTTDEYVSQHNRPAVPQSENEMLDREFREDEDQAALLAELAALTATAPNSEDQ